MDLRTEPIFDALKQPLGLVEDERRRQIETYLETARLPVERATYDVVSEIVQHIDERVGENYRVRLEYRPGGLALEIEEKAASAEEGPWNSTLEGDVEKITIRIPAELKDLATQAAARAGTSANTWFVKSLARALRNIDVQAAEPASWREDRREDRGDERRRGGRLSGWVGGDE